ncbi:MAG: glycine cleavage system protein GcvH [Gammaproteobacteria bacterium]
MNKLSKDLRYTASHEWVRRDSEHEITIGITEHAQEALGDLVYAEIYPVGKRLEAGDVCAVVESVKAASDVYAPVAGTIAAGNPALAQSPEIINRDPYGEGWLLKVKTAHPVDLTDLLDAAGYERVLAEAH